MAQIFRRQKIAVFISEKRSVRITISRENNIGIIVREPLAFGFLTGKYKPGHAFPKDDHRRRFSQDLIEKNLEKIKSFKKILSTERLSLVQASLEYALQFEEVGTVIPGMKSVEQVTENTVVSEDPKLRPQEYYHLREMYSREEIFKEPSF